MSETRFLPPFIPSKWRELRGLVEQVVLGVARVEGLAVEAAGGVANVAPVPATLFLPSASPLGLRPPKSGRPAPNSPISSLSDCGFQPERTETARDLTKNPAVIEDTYTAVGTKRQLKDASRIIGVLRMWYEAESGVSLSVATDLKNQLQRTPESPRSDAELYNSVLVRRF